MGFKCKLELFGALVRSWGSNSLYCGCDVYWELLWSLLEKEKEREDETLLFCLLNCGHWEKAFGFSDVCELKTDWRNLFFSFILFSHVEIGIYSIKRQINVNGLIHFHEQSPSEGFLVSHLKHVLVKATQSNKLFVSGLATQYNYPLCDLVTHCSFLQQKRAIFLRKMGHQWTAEREDKSKVWRKHFEIAPKVCQ